MLFDDEDTRCVNRPSINSLDLSLSLPVCFFRTFYETLVDLRVVVPPVLLSEGHEKV